MDMSKKKCKLCNKTFSHSYNLFGRGCFNAECDLLNIAIPKSEKDKEKYFCNEIARKLNKYGISQSKKYDLTEKYLTLQYLNKIKYGDLSKEKRILKKEIDNISFSKSVKEMVDKLVENKVQNTIDVWSPTITLNKTYKLYKITLKFNQKLTLLKKELEKAKNDEERDAVVEKYLLEDLKFVFDITKIGIPIYYNATVNILGDKYEDKWRLSIMLKDKYDFTDPRLKDSEYKKSPLGSILNNCGVVSQQYGVIRPYNVFIEFKYDDFENEVN